jgi:hypothetical protein
MIILMKDPPVKARLGLMQGCKVDSGEIKANFK